MSGSDVTKLNVDGGTVCSTFLQCETDGQSGAGGYRFVVDVAGRKTGSFYGFDGGVSKSVTGVVKNLYFEKFSPFIQGKAEEDLTFSSHSASRQRVLHGSSVNKRRSVAASEAQILNPAG